MRTDYGNINGWPTVPDDPRLDEQDETDQEQEENAAADRGEAFYKEEMDFD